MARVIVPTAGMSILLCCLAGLPHGISTVFNKTLRHLLTASVAKVEAAEELEVISHELRYQLRQYRADAMKRLPAVVSGLLRKADDWLARAREVADTDQEKELIGKDGTGLSPIFSTSLPS